MLKHSPLAVVFDELCLDRRETGVAGFFFAMSCCHRGARFLPLLGQRRSILTTFLDLRAQTPNPCIELAQHVDLCHILCLRQTDGLQRLLGREQVLVALKQRHAIAQRRHLAFQAIDLQSQLFQFLTRFQLIDPRPLVFVQGLLIPEDVVHQVEQLPRRQLAQFVGCPLFKGEHAQDRLAQATCRQAMTVLLDAHKAFFVGAELLNAHIPRLDAVLPLPLATTPHDPAGQGHLVGGHREKRTAAAMIALIRHHRSEPGIRTVRMLYVGRIGPFARGVKGEDRAHGVE